jgi:hypothetical protein
LENIDGRPAVERRAGHRHEAVDRDAFGCGVESAEDFEHLEPVGLRFAHADDATATDRHPGLLDGADGVEPVVEGVGRDDAGIKFRAGVDVVIVGGDPGGAELARGLGREFAKRDADFHAELAHGADRFEDRLELGVVLRDAAPCRAHAEAGAAVGPCALGGFEDAVEWKERLLFEAGVVMGALGTVGTILAATAGLDTQERAKLHLMLRPVSAISLAGLLKQVEKGQVVKRAEGGQVVSRHG